MLKAKKRPILDSLCYLYLKRMLRKQFDSVEICGLMHLEKIDPERPVLAFANHTNWWDGLVVFFLTRFLPHKFWYCMMEEKQLCQYPFFRWLGAFSIDLSHPTRAAQSIRYGLKLLHSPKNLVWVFPEGELKNFHRPICIRPGTSFLAQHVPHAQLLPCSFGYLFFDKNRPKLLIQIGQPIEAKNASDEVIEKNMQELVARLKETAQTADFSNYKRVLESKPSIDQKWQRFWHLFQRVSKS